MLSTFPLGMIWFRREVSHSIEWIGQQLEALLKTTSELSAIEEELQRIEGAFRFFKFSHYELLLKELQKTLVSLSTKIPQERKEELDVFSYVLMKIPLLMELLTEEDNSSLHWVLCVNQLRNSRGDELLSGQDLVEFGVLSDQVNFLSVLPVIQEGILTDEKRQELIKKAKYIYQKAYVEISKNQPIAPSLVALAYALNQLKRLIKEASAYTSLVLAGALIEAIQLELIPLGKESKRLLGLIASQLEKWEKMYPVDVRDIQQKGIALFLSALSLYQGQTKKIEAIKFLLKPVLDVEVLFLLCYEFNFSSVSKDKKTISQEFLAELTDIHEKLDHFMILDQRAIDDLDEIMQKLIALAQVLNISGFKHLANIVTAQHNALSCHSTELLSGDFNFLGEVIYRLMAVECCLYGLIYVFPADLSSDQEQEIICQNARNNMVSFSQKVISENFIEEIKRIKYSLFGEADFSPVEKEFSAEEKIFPVPYQQVGECVKDLRMLRGICVVLELAKPVYLLDLWINSLMPYDAAVSCLSTSAKCGLADALAALELDFTWREDFSKSDLCDGFLDRSLQGGLLIPHSILKSPHEIAQEKQNIHTASLLEQKPSVQLTPEVFVQEAEKLVSEAHEKMKIWVKDGSEIALDGVLSAYRVLNNKSKLIHAVSIEGFSGVIENLVLAVIENQGQAGAAFVIWMEKAKEKMKVLINDFSQNETSFIPVDELIEDAKKLILKVKKNVKSEEPLKDWVFDQTLVAIFHEEILAQLKVLESWVHVESHEPTSSSLLVDVFHALQSASRLVGADSLFELSWMFERFVKAAIVKNKILQSDVVIWVSDFIRHLHDQVDESKRGKLVSIKNKIQLIDSLKILAALYFEKSEVESIFLAKQDSSYHQSLLMLFQSGNLGCLIKAADCLSSWHFNGARAEEISRVIEALMVLSDYAQTLKFTFITELCDALVEYYDRLKSGPMTDKILYEQVHEAHQGLVNALDQLAADQPVQSLEMLAIQLQASLSWQSEKLFLDDDFLDEKINWDQEDSQSIAYDEELVDMFLDEANDLVVTALLTLQNWVVAPQELLLAEELCRDLHTLKGGARLVGIRPIELIAHQLTNLYEGVCDNRVKISEELLDLLMDTHDVLASQIQSLRETYSCSIDKALHLKLQQVIDHMSPRSMRQDYIANLLMQDPVSVVEKKTEHDVADDFLNSDVLEIFLEEADELVEQMDEKIQEWLKNPKYTRNMPELQRILHTLKGGARLTKLIALGDFSHECEQFLIEAESRGIHDDSFFKELTLRKMRVVELLNEAKNSAGQDKIFAQEKASAQKIHAKSVDSNSPELSEDKDSDWVASGQKDFLKVSAELLDKLVNLSAESSLTRGRIEHQVNEFHQITHEMGYSLQRMKELLRKLEVEAETRVSSDAKKMPAKYAEFDSMEMERYSTLYHLSKSLSESALDLTGLRDSLTEKYRDAEALLVHQSRLHTDLQDKLLQSRMVPFSRLLPRLRHLVKQVSEELNKKVDFEFVGVEDKLDRTLLERMLVPLEHMLRNAIDHGMETSEERIALGKSEQGRITLLLAREGTEVVLRLSDDGRGIDVDQVKKIALGKGLIEEHADLSNHDILQFIFKSGFSTRAEVTQISGRGIGMDVVYREIKQVGGSMKIHSAPNVGTQFSIRLPFTVSLHRALMMKVGEDSYAVPMSHVEGIIRLSSDELSDYYRHPEKQLLHLGKQYQIKYLGLYVHGEPIPRLGQSTQSLPVLLVRGGDRSIALQVDSVLGSREVVVQSVGPQLSSVSGISGATILGDGSIVIILDLISLLRAERAGGRAHAVQSISEMEQALSLTSETLNPATHVLASKVLVVDDSVTVRRVIQRLLGRHGLKVSVAKDGVEAMMSIRHERPEIIIVDIEMPRMDGFELVTWMRNDENLRTIPVIMITSRVGEKHRQRAEELGVKHYLGKPFQEEGLLEIIHDVLNTPIQSGVYPNE